MTRMFKQLVESSRKKLSKAATAGRDGQAAQAIESVAEPHKKPDFEPLESRVLFSGVGNGFNKKSVTFFDAWGDAVHVRLIGGPAAARFDITLDGGARDHADIQNITINGKASTSTVLDLFVTPHRVNTSSTYTGGHVTVPGEPDPVYAVTKTNQVFTPGFVEIGSIYASTNLRGISLNGADFENINIQGSVGLGSRTIGHGSHAQTHLLHGGIAVDIGVGQFSGGLLYDPVQKIDFGNITVSGGVDSLVLHGRTDTPSSNNLNGSITIGTSAGTGVTDGISLNSIDAKYSDVLAPISIGTGGIKNTAFFNDILANVTSSGPIGQFNADNLIAEVNSSTSIASLALTGSLLGTAVAPSFGAVSVDGQFTGLLKATGPDSATSELPNAIGSVIINSSTAFTGTIEAVTGNIGNIVLTQAATPFSGHVTSDAGSIGNITAGFFSNAGVYAATGIGNITSNATTATVASGIVNSVFKAGTLGIGNISSVASITNSQFEAVGGPILNVTVLQGGLSGVVLGGSTTTLATSIGNITANLSIEGTSAIASGAIGNVVSIAGHIGGSSNTATFNKPGLVITSTSTGSLLGSGVVTIGGGTPGPKADVFIGGSIGNIYALGDISGNVITATAGNIKNITSHEGRIAFDAVTASGNIGNIYANSQDASFAFDSAGNVLEQNDFVASYGTTPVPSASAIDNSVFNAGGTIGGITAISSAVGGEFSLPGLSLAGGSTSSNHYAPIRNAAIEYSFFTAATGIAVGAGQSITAVDHSTYNWAAIEESTFTVTGAANPIGTAVIGPVMASGTAGPGIRNSNFHAVSGDISNITGTSFGDDGIVGSNIQADAGNVGIVKGVSLGASGGNGDDGIRDTTILTGSAGGIKGIYGKGPGYVGTSGGAYAAAYASKVGTNNYSGGTVHTGGIEQVIATAGTGGIGYIKGYTTGNNTHSVSDGINYSTFKTTGTITSVTGTSTHGSGIYQSWFYANKIGNVTGISTGYGESEITVTGLGELAGVVPNNGTIHGYVYYGAGISKSQFFAQSGIGNITGIGTNVVGTVGNQAFATSQHVLATGILDSYFNANTSLDGTGAIGTITGISHGKSSGIDSSGFYAGAGIGAIYGGATSVYGVSGITHSKFNADETFKGLGGIVSITGKTIGKGSGGFFSYTYANKITSTTVTKVAPGSGAYGIYDSTFLAGGGTPNGIGNIYGYANGAYSSSGIANSTFDADIARLFTSGIGNIKGVSKSQQAVFSDGNAATGFFGDGIVASTFTAGKSIGNVTGTTTAPGTYVHSYYNKTTKATTYYNSFVAGIGNSSFFANAGKSSETGGTGTIGAVLGTASASGAAGVHSGIQDSLFVAGGGPSSTGTITSVTGTAIVNGPGELAVYGINHSTFVGGSSNGTIGPVVGTAVAQGSQVEEQLVVASGIAHSYFYAGVGATAVAGNSGTITSITGSGTAEAAFGTAYGSGIWSSVIQAGSNEKGTIGTITGTGIANAAFNGGAYGILKSSIQAAPLSGGKGYIGAVTGTATANSQLYATAEGIAKTGIVSGYAYGKITSIAGTGKAYGESGAYAAGILGVSASRKGSYGFDGINGYTIEAGIGVGGSAVVGTITGTAIADANTGDGDVAAGGLSAVVIKVGYGNGSIGAITASGTATNGLGTGEGAYAAGIGQLTGTSLIAAGFGYGGVGSITSVTATGTATTLSGDAYAGGIYNTTIESGFKHGTIGTVTATATATVTGSAYNVTAHAYGIYKSNIFAGFNGTYGKIGNVYGTATASATSSANANATAFGIFGSDILAAAIVGKATPDSGTGIIGVVKGISTATTVGYNANSFSAGIRESYIIAASGDFGTGTITSVYGHGTATATITTSNDTEAEARAYGIDKTHIGAGTGYKSTGTITNGVYGKANATATAHGVGPDYAFVKAHGIDLSEIYAGAYGKDSTGTIGPVKGYAYGKAVGGKASSLATGINGTTISAGTSEPVLPAAGTYNGTIGNVTGYGKALATSTYASATTTAAGLDHVTIRAADGAHGAGKIGAVSGKGVAHSSATGAGGNATATANGIDPSYIYAGSDTPASGPATGGVGLITSILGQGYAYATTAGNATTGKTYGYGINGLTVLLGDAGTSAVPATTTAIAGTGTISGGITGDAKAYTNVPTTGFGYATAAGVKNLFVHLSDAYGTTYSLAKSGAVVGGLTSHAYAYVNKAPAAPADKATVKSYGLDTVGIYVSNATAGAAKGDVAKGAIGTIGGISQVQKAYANAGGPDGLASAKAEPIVSLKLIAGNAYGAAAYGGTGNIAKGKTISGTATATATGYHTYALATGLAAIKASAGNAVGAYYATGGSGYVGQLVGNGTATATSTAVAGSVTSTAKAYGIEGATVYAGNAEVLSPLATGPSIATAGGAIAGFLGTATATATSTSPFNGTSLAKAQGIDDVYAYAGNAANFGAGPAKTFYGKIGNAGPIVGTATATAHTHGGGAASAKAYAYGIDAISLNAANAATYGGGVANAKNAVAYIANVKGTGTATAYAYGKTDPYAKAIAAGVVHFTLRAGNAFVEKGGTAAAYAAGSTGGVGSATIEGIKGTGTATSTAKGTASTATPVTSYSGAAGILYGTKPTPLSKPAQYGIIQAADAYTTGTAYGGDGNIGAGYGVLGTAVGSATSTAINGSPAPALATVYDGGINFVDISAGSGHSYGKTGTADGGDGTVGVITGSGTGTATSTGSPSKAKSHSFGTYHVTALSGDAYGANAYAGPGSIGAVTGTATDMAIANVVSGGTLTYTYSIAYGLKDIHLSAGTALAKNTGNADGNTGGIGAITGTASATATSGTYTLPGYATARGAGIKNLYAYAGYAYGNSASAGTGTIGATNGTGSATAKGGTAYSKFWGIDPVKLYAGVAKGVEGANGGAGSLVNAVTGTGAATSNGYNANAYSYGITHLYVKSGSATAGTFATGESGTIDAISGTATTIADATDPTIHTYGVAQGLYHSNFSAGSATGYFAEAGAGTILNIGGTATDTVTGDPFDASISTKNLYGIADVNVNAGDAHGTSGYFSTGVGATSSVGDITGSATGTLTGSTFLGGNVSAPHSMGIDNLTVLAGYAYGFHRATAGSATVATGTGISGTLGLTINGTVLDSNGTITAAHSHGISGLKIKAADAGAGGSGSDRTYATGNTATIGGITGAATVKLTGKTYGSGQITSNDASGLREVNVYGGSAGANYNAKAGAATLGAVSGTVVNNVTGTSVNGGTGKVGTAGSDGIDELNVNLGNASASTTYKGAVATGAAGGITSVYGKTTQTVTGTTTTGNVYTTNSVGIDGAHAHLGSASAYLIAHAGAGTLGTLIGKSLIGVTGTTVTGNVTGFNVYGLRSTSWYEGNASANTGNKTSAAFGGNSTAGAIYGNGNLTVNGTTTGNSTTVSGDDVYGIRTFAMHVGDASAYGADSGTASVAAGTTIEGYATSAVTANQKGTNSDVYAGTTGDKVIGIQGMTITAGVATGNNALKIGFAASFGGTVGSITGKGGGTTTENGTAEYNSLSYVRGVDTLTVSAGTATASTALVLDPGSIGAIYGLGGANNAGSAILTHHAYAQAFGLNSVILNAGTASSGYAKGVADGDTGTIGALTGKGYAHATGNTAATTSVSVANGYGIDSLTAKAGVATGYSATAGAGNIAAGGTIYGKSVVTATGYKATITNSIGIGSISSSVVLDAGNAYGGASGAKALTAAAQGLIGSFTASASATAIGNTTKALGAATVVTASGIDDLTANAGKAIGLAATGGPASSIGGLNGQAVSSATAYVASDTFFTGGIANSILTAGNAYGTGKVHAGAGSSVAAGGQIYGKATASAISNGPAAINGTAYVRTAAGIATTVVRTGYAFSDTGAGDKAYGGAGTVGNVKGVALATGTSTVGKSATGDFSYGIGNTTVTAGGAKGYDYAAAGAGAIGSVSGKATSHFDGGLPTVTANPGSQAVYGLTSVTALAGYADATGGAGTAKGGGPSSIASLLGYAYAYSTVSAASGTATAHAYGIHSITATSGDAKGFIATAGAGTVGKVDGFAKAIANGFATAVVSKGIDPSTIQAGVAAQVTIDTVVPLGPSGSATAANGTIGLGSGVYGYAYGNSQSSGGNSTSTVYGINSLTLNSATASGSGGKAGLGTIVKVTSTAKSYSLDSKGGTQSARAYAIEPATFNAGYGGSTSSSIGQVKGYATASNAAPGAAVTGTSSFASGIGKYFSYGATFLSGGSITGVTGKAYSGNGFETAGIQGAAITAGTSVGAIIGTNSGAGTNAHGMTHVTVNAGTTIGNITGSNTNASPTGASDGIKLGKFRAANTGGTGATAAIGTVTASTGAAIGNTSFGGLDSSIFTTSGSIGAVTVTGNVINTYGVNAGFFAGDLLTGGFAITGSTETDGASIASGGTVSVTGDFINNDLVASIHSGGGSYFGKTTDTGTTGTIGNVTIATGVSLIPFAHPLNASEPFSIEAHTVGTFTDHTTAYALPGVLLIGSDIVVRTL